MSEKKHTEDKEKIRSKKDSIDHENDQEKKDHLDPNWGESYNKFVGEKHKPGTASYMAHQLMEGMAENEKSAATNLIQNTLGPADLLSYILREAETNPEAASAIRQEIVKRLRKKGIEE